MRQKLRDALLAALAAGTACLLPGLAADSAGNAAEQIVILCTNDVHCETDQWKDGDGTVENLGYPGVAAYRQEMEALCGAENVTLVDAGDAIQGSAVGTLSDGAYLVEIMNQVGYDYAVPGNHEFDYGMDHFLALAAGEDKKADYTYLCANFRDKDGELIFHPYEIVDYGPVQVAYVGVSTPETISKSTPVYFQDENGRYIYSFGRDGTKLYEDVQSAVDQARKEGADYVVAVAHLGQTGITKAWRSDEVVAHTTGIDVMFDGHSHRMSWAASSGRNTRTGTARAGSVPTRRRWCPLPDRTRKRSTPTSRRSTGPMMRSPLPAARGCSRGRGMPSPRRPP